MLKHFDDDDDGDRQTLTRTTIERSIVEPILIPEQRWQLDVNSSAFSLQIIDCEMSNENLPKLN